MCFDEGTVIFLHKIWYIILYSHLLFPYSFNEKRTLELIEYLTEMPPQGCNHDRGHKFPFLANQIFTDGEEGLSAIIEKFFYSKQEVVVESPKPQKETPKTSAEEFLVISEENDPEEVKIELNMEENP